MQMLELSNQRIKILIFLFPIALFLIFLIIRTMLDGVYEFINEDDNVIEYAQVFFYFLASILSLLISIRFLKNKLTLHGTLYSILAVFLLFVCLEEISWGQRIFNIELPDYFKQHNAQGEITLHNLGRMQYTLDKFYILLGAYGAFAWLFMRRFMSRAKTKCSHILNFIVPDWFLSSYFFFCFVVFILVDSRLIRSGWQEPVELILSLGFFFFAVVNYIKSQVCLIRSTQTF